MTTRTLLMMLALASGAFAQEQPPVAADSARRELPQLEIPEITIVGKKAITLPFARKGEIYTVPVFEAPPPDSAMVNERLSTGVPVPPLPRYEERMRPWHVSMEGGIGSFGQLSLHGYADYSSKTWGMQVDGGFDRTGGHADNSSGTGVGVRGSGYSLFATDSDLLGALRASVDFGIQGESYGMFGIPEMKVERDRTGLLFGAGLSTASASGNAVSLGVGIRTWSVSDAANGNDSSVTSASPSLTASAEIETGRLRLLSSLSYSGSSVSGDGASESPSLLSFTAGARWRIAEEWYLQIGGVFASGSDAEHTTRALVAPQALVRWQPDADREIDVWWLPDITLASYDDRIRENPYLVRSPGMPVEKRPVRIGSSFRFRSGIVALEVTGAYTKIHSLPLTIERDGRLSIEAADAHSVMLQTTARISTTGNSRLTMTGTFTRTREEGAGVQAPMHPAIRLKASGELDLDIPLTLWSSLEFVGARNTNRSGSESIGSAFVMNAGGSLRAFSRVSLTAELRNLFGTASEWWKSYAAPGREFRLHAYLGIL